MFLGIELSSPKRPASLGMFHTFIRNAEFAVGILVQKQNYTTIK